MYPDVKIYAVEEPDGKIAPVLVDFAGIALPVVFASLDADPNGARYGTRAMTATIVVQIGAESGLEIVESREELAAIEAELRPLETAPA